MIAKYTVVAEFHRRVRDIVPRADQHLRTTKGVVIHAYRGLRSIWPGHAGGQPQVVVVAEAGEIAFGVDDVQDVGVIQSRICCA